MLLLLYNGDLIPAVPVTMRYYVTVRGGKVKLEIYTVPQVKSKIICFSSLTYVSTVLNGLHQGEWPLQVSHTMIT